MIGLVLAACASAGAVVTASRALARARQSGPQNGDDLTKALATADASGIERALARTFPETGKELADAIYARLPPEAGVALVNETLGEVDRELSTARDVVRSAVRIALFSGSFGAILELIYGMSDAADAHWALAGQAFLSGALGAGICFEIGRRVAARVEEARVAWDRVGAALAGPLQIRRKAARRDRL